MRAFLVWLMSAGFAFADGERAGDFDYYVLALSWSPTWCALEGDRRGSPQCDPDENRGWILHGLWPQYEQGWPSYCPTSARNPSRAETRALEWLYGSAGSAWHQWNKHGRCSGMSADDYYDVSREAFGSVRTSDLFRVFDRDLRLPASVIEEAFLEDNPELRADGVTVTCKAGRIQEVRVCLTRDLEPRLCSGSVARDCRMQDALLSPIR
ncbi:MAG: ribonuclease T2 [Boseongicola sp.]|nr:ribonuclease T2 [Boseongicola sp.]NNJ67256.1 ribonuclease T2 [Boseongicola sp.]